MPRTPQSKASPPLYVLRARETCPGCGKASNAYALLAAGLYDALEEDSFASHILLRNIEHLPTHLLARLTERCPGWRFDRDDAAAPAYLMNHCRHCGAKLTDYYTQAEPGAAFYPCSKEDCWNISTYRLPVNEAVSLVCTWSIGGLPTFLDYDHAEPWEALPAAY